MNDLQHATQISERTREESEMEAHGVDGHKLELHEVSPQLNEVIEVRGRLGKSLRSLLHRLLRPT